MDYEAFLEFVRTRRTIRAIEPDPIPEGVMAKLMRDKEEMIHFDKAGPDEFLSEDKVRE